MVGYEGLYEVSSEGRVRSLDRFYMRGNTQIPVRSRLMKPSVLKNRAGHLTVGLRKNNKPSTLYIHRLVCEAFHGPAPEDKPWALHRDDDKLNNTKDNLYWGTPKENSADCIRNGLHAPSNAVSCPKNHPYDEENTYRHPSGGRVCKTCRREGQRARALRQPPSDYHGTLTGYTSYHCRCEECKGVWSEYSRKRRSGV